jgi:hypothetical protein
MRLPDGSTLKVSAPTPVSPINDVRLTNRQPTLQIANAQGRFAGGTFGYEFVVLDMTGRAVRSVTVGSGEGSTSWVYPRGDELQGNARYQWRARAVLDGAHGPWSSLATFQTVAAPPNCGFVDPWWQSREACAQTIAATSMEWRSCQSGSHVACHRFTREVASALAMGDPNWGLLGKSPGVQQCTMDRCGALGGEGFGEDIVAYCRNPATCRNRLGPDGRNDIPVDRHHRGRGRDQSEAQLGRGREPQQQGQQLLGSGALSPRPIPWAARRRAAPPTHRCPTPSTATSRNVSGS